MLGKIINNQIVLPPVNNGNKLNVNQDSNWLDANGFRELTAAKINTAKTAKEAAYQAAKSTTEKKRDNWALNIIVAMKAKYPAAILTAQDISRSPEELAPLLIDQEISDEDSAKLMQVKAAVGTSRLPSQLHILT